MSQTKAVVYIVHAVDVEGPMTETIEATFERMWSFGLPRNIEPSQKLLSLIKQGDIGLPGVKLSPAFYRCFSDHLLNYWTTWEQIDSMLLEINSERFRFKYSGSDGSPYVLSWFIYDHHEGFKNNPRYHATGTHAIFDHYMSLFLRDNLFNDGIGWHYHHSPVNGDALGSNTSWSSMVDHESIIARRIIEREWYFDAFRAGLHIERDDLSHWLEMYFPFDFSARYCPPGETYRPGLVFDWRGCPARWGAWHPDWYDYRRPGKMARWLFRCTDLYTYMHTLSEDEVRQAFSEARENGNSVLVYYNHDYRDMRVEIQLGYDVIKRVHSENPDVDFRFVSATEAAQLHLGLQPKKPLISCSLEGSILNVCCDSEIFGPQPYLAVQQGSHFFRDNFTSEGNNSWSYEIQYPEETVALGVAANSISGAHDLKVLQLRKS